MKKKRWLIFLLVFVFVCNITLFVRVPVNADDEIEIKSKSAYLVEADSGKVLYEKDALKEMAPASITKIMTLLLIFEALDSGKIHLEDNVRVSAHAASMGGSQVFLEENEVQTVNDMIKCISIASANDACVAMAEFLSTSEDAFVKKMNERAKDLGMNNTNFVNCCGLDVENHYSCAKDIAIMGMELMSKFPQVSEYATTWQDSIVHVNSKGVKSEFGLTNTNKLVRTYDGITGLKTGSTSEAGYCLCASSERNGMKMVAVVMSASDHKSRFSECAKLMDYGYGKCQLYTDENDYSSDLSGIYVKGSIEGTVSGEWQPFKYILVGEESPDGIHKEFIYKDEYLAPIKKGDEIGSVRYTINGEEIGNVKIIALEDVEKSSYKDYLIKAIHRYFKV